MGNEQRGQVRRQLMCYLEVVEQSSEVAIGRLVDLTEGGMMLIGAVPVRPKTCMRVELILSEELKALIHEKLLVEVRCCWSKQDVNPDYYVSGFCFQNISSSQRATIQNVIAFLAFQDA